MFHESLAHLITSHANLIIFVLSDDLLGFRGRCLWCERLNLITVVTTEMSKEDGFH